MPAFLCVLCDLCGQFRCPKVGWFDLDTRFAPNEWAWFYVPNLMKSAPRAVPRVVQPAEGFVIKPPGAS
jgi:hypothetical protein